MARVRARGRGGEARIEFRIRKRLALFLTLRRGGAMGSGVRDHEGGVARIERRAENRRRGLKSRSSDERARWLDAPLRRRGGGGVYRRPSPLLGVLPVIFAAFPYPFTPDRSNNSDDNENNNNNNDDDDRILFSFDFFSFASNAFPSCRPQLVSNGRVATRFVLAPPPPPRRQRLSLAPRSMRLPSLVSTRRPL